MSRMLSRFAVFLACLPAATLLPCATFAQGNARPGRARISGAAKQPTNRQDVSPALMQVLKEWYENTKKIERLEGKHWKYTYDFTFNIEKRAKGQFYYQSPDKGRIDIEPARIPKDTKSDRKDSRGRPLTVQADQQVIWLSTGKNIYQISPLTKKAKVFPIPDKAQGRNIMDGPLPFLLGMPPDKALARYRLQIMKDKYGRTWNTKTTVRLKVFPRWKSDSVNFREAQVFLDKTNHYLPSAVLMIHPGKNKETVYVFKDMVVNKNQFLDNLFGKNWWVTPLKGVKIEQMGGRVAQRKRGIPTRLPKDMLPNVAGYPVKDAQNRLTKMGLKVELVNGGLARSIKEVGRVESQLPTPYTKFRKGQKVLLACYVDPRSHKVAQFRTVPNLRNMYYKDAKKKLEQLGFTVNLRRGSVASTSKLTYCVQDQYPLSNGKTIAGTNFILTLYLPKPRTAAKPQR